MMVSTQIHDSTRGVPGGRIPVELDLFVEGQGWKEVGYGITNADGDIADFGELKVPGVYRLMYDIGTYMPETYFPSIAITFEVRDITERHRVALVLSAYGYTTYRMS